MALELTLKELDRSTWPMTLTSEAYPDGHPIAGSSTVAIYVRKYGETSLAIDGGTCTADADQVTNPGVITFSPSDVQATALATALGTDRSAAFEVEVVVTLADTTTERYPSNEFGRLTLWESLKGS